MGGINIPKRLAHLPPAAAKFILAVERSGTFEDEKEDGPCYCQIEAGVCEEMCQFLISCFGWSVQLLSRYQQAVLENKGENDAVKET